MNKNPFTLEEVRAMWDDKDTLSIIAMFLIVTAPVFDFIAYVLYAIDSEYYYHWEWIIPSLVFIVSLAFIYLYRPWFCSNLDKKVEKFAHILLSECEKHKDELPATIKDRFTDVDELIKRRAWNLLIEYGELVDKRK